MALAQPGLRRSLERLARGAAGRRSGTVTSRSRTRRSSASGRGCAGGSPTMPPAATIQRTAGARRASEWDAEGREPHRPLAWHPTAVRSRGRDGPARGAHPRRARLPARRPGGWSRPRSRRYEERADATSRQNRRLRWLLVGLAGCCLVLALVAGWWRSRRAARHRMLPAKRGSRPCVRTPRRSLRRPQRGTPRTRPAAGGGGNEARRRPGDVRRPAHDAHPNPRAGNPCAHREPVPAHRGLCRRVDRLPVRQRGARCGPWTPRRRGALGGAQSGGRRAVGHGRHGPRRPLGAAPVLGDRDGTVLAILDATQRAVLQRGHGCGASTGGAGHSHSGWRRRPGARGRHRPVHRVPSLPWSTRTTGASCAPAALPPHTPFALGFPDGRVGYQDESGSTVVVDLRTGRREAS